MGRPLATDRARQAGLIRAGITLTDGGDGPRPIVGLQMLQLSLEGLFLVALASVGRLGLCGTPDARVRGDPFLVWVADDPVRWLDAVSTAVRPEPDAAPAEFAAVFQPR